MGKKLISDPEITKTIFKKCPICKEGTVSEKRTKVLFGLTSLKSIQCSSCNATWNKKGDELTLAYIKKPHESRVKDIPLSVNEWERIAKTGKSTLEEIVEGIEGGNPRKIDNIDGIDVHLHKNEDVYLADTAELHQYRSERVSGSSRVRLAKGIYLPGSPATTRQVLRPISSGVLFLTGKRLILTGNPKSVNISIPKIIQIETRKDGFAVHSGKNQPDVFVLTGDKRKIWTPEIWVKAINLVCSK